MKSIFTIAIVGAVMLSSCSTYRQGQTPDDVYYSPSREVRSGNNAYVETQSDRQEGRRSDDYSNSRSGYSAYDDFATMDDRWLMMRVRNPYRWSMFDDYSYFNTFSPYGMGGYGMGGFHSPYNNFGWGGYQSGWSFGLGFGGYNPWGLGGGYGHFNNYSNWNNYYNPYYGGVVIVTPKSNRANFNRNFNLNNYSNNNVNSRVGTSNGRPQFNNTNRIRYNNSNNSTLGGSNRRNSNSNSEYYRQPSSSSDRPSRTYSPSNNNNNSPSYSPSSSGNSGSSGSSGGNSGGGGSRPSRR